MRAKMPLMRHRYAQLTWMQLLAAVGLNLFVLLPRPSVAQVADDNHWRLELKMVGRYNPVGIALRPALGYRVPLSDSDHLLLKGTHVEAGFLGATSPAAFNPGAYLSVVPIAPLVLRVRVQQLRYCGAFGNLKSFDGTSPNWSDDVRDTDFSSGRHGTAMRAEASAQFRAYLKGVAAVAQYSIGLYQADISLGRSWYEPSDDLLLQRTDHVHRAHSLLGWYAQGTPFSAQHLMFGGLWQGHWVERADYSRHIGGLVIGYRPGWMKARKLTALLLAARYLQDPYRTDELYIGTIVSMTWERLSSKGEQP